MKIERGRKMSKFTLIIVYFILIVYFNSLYVKKLFIDSCIYWIRPLISGPDAGPIIGHIRLALSGRFPSPLRGPARCSYNVPLTNILACKQIISLHRGFFLRNLIFFSIKSRRVSDERVLFFVIIFTNLDVNEFEGIYERELETYTFCILFNVRFVRFLVLRSIRTPF